MDSTHARASPHDRTVIGRPRDEPVMTPALWAASVRSMTDPDIQMFVLDEFRLSVADTDGAVSRIVRESGVGRETAVPLLTSVDDRRDVATVRGLHAGDAAEDEDRHDSLDPFVASWHPPRHYAPRIAERSQSPATSYRLAVTESGINDADPALLLPRTTGQDGTSTDIGLLWVGQPIGTQAGLMVLLGNIGDVDATSSEERHWAVALSRRLGVRIYESSVP